MREPQRFWGLDIQLVKLSSDKEIHEFAISHVSRDGLDNHADYLEPPSPYQVVLDKIGSLENKKQGRQHAKTVKIRRTFAQDSNVGAVAPRAC